MDFILIKNLTVLFQHPSMWFPLSSQSVLKMISMFNHIHILLNETKERIKSATTKKAAYLTCENSQPTEMFHRTFYIYIPSKTLVTMLYCSKEVEEIFFLAGCVVTQNKIVDLLNWTSLGLLCVWNLLIEQWVMQTGWICFNFKWAYPLREKN